MSAFDHVAGIPPTRISDGVSARAVHGQNVSLGVIEFQPGAGVPEHSHANEQLGVLLQGSMTFRIGDESRVVEPGDTWCISAHVPHEVVAAGPDGAVAAEVFSPPRHDWSSLDRLEPGPGRWP
ncbi:MAG TPA: cupin domain-containing protein [Gaiellaceae bacterium]|jgi:quercetin dioxygenase-like cupin family protein